MGIFKANPFAALNAQLAQLSTTPDIPLAAAHQPLARHVWLSMEPDAGAELAVTGGADGLTLNLKTIGRSDWLSLSFAVPIRAVQKGRFLVLIIQTDADGFVSYRPCLRYLLREGGFQDQFCRDYVVTSGGVDQQLSYLEVDADLLARAQNLEVHLFFQGTRFQIRLPRIETALIV